MLRGFYQVNLTSFIFQCVAHTPLSLSLSASAQFPSMSRIHLSLSLSLCVCSVLSARAHPLSLSLCVCSVSLPCRAHTSLSLSLRLLSFPSMSRTHLSLSASAQLLSQRAHTPLSLSLSLRLLSFSSAIGREEQRFNSVKHRYYVASLILHASIAEITAQLWSLSYVYLISSDDGAIIMIFLCRWTSWKRDLVM